MYLYHTVIYQAPLLAIDKNYNKKYNSAMRKIFEIDSIEVYNRTGVFAHLGHRTYTRKPNTRNAHFHDEWLKAALTPAQQKFIKDRITVFRPHPRHSPTVEVYVDEQQLTDRDWTAIKLLF